MLIQLSQILHAVCVAFYKLHTSIVLFILIKIAPVLKMVCYYFKDEGKD